MTDAEAGVRAKHAETIRKVAAFLAATRIAGWGNPLVISLVDAADYLDGTRPPADTGEAVLSSLPTPPHGGTDDC